MHAYCTPIARRKDWRNRGERISRWSQQGSLEEARWGPGRIRRTPEYARCAKTRDLAKARPSSSIGRFDAARGLEWDSGHKKGLTCGCRGIDEAVPRLKWEAGRFHAIGDLSLKNVWRPRPDRRRSGKDCTCLWSGARPLLLFDRNWALQIANRGFVSGSQNLIVERGQVRKCCRLCLRWLAPDDGGHDRAMVMRRTD